MLIKNIFKHDNMVIPSFLDIYKENIALNMLIIY